MRESRDAESENLQLNATRAGGASGCQDGTRPVPYRGMRFLRKRTVPPRITSPRLVAPDGCTFDGQSTPTRSTPWRATSGIALRRYASGVLRAGNAPRRSRWRVVLAAALVMFLLALIDHAAMLHSETHRSHHSQAALSAAGDAFTAHADHTYLLHGSLTECHDALAAVALPRAAATLMELGVAVAVAVITAVQASLTAPFVRGPPKVPRAALAGQDLLTRFCLTRR